jgi:hypothetical protein
MASELTAAWLGEADYAAWTRMVTESPGGSVYSSPEYLDALCTAAGGTFRILAVRRGAELAGGVALYERRGPLGGGSYVAPRLLLYYNGIVLRRAETRYPSERTARQLKTLTVLEQALGSGGYGLVNLRSRGLTDVRPFVGERWSIEPSYSYVVGLHDLPAAWGRVEQNLRRLIERCAGNGVLLADDDDFDGFFRLHAATMERKDTGAYLPRPAFERYFRLLRERGLCRLFHARLPDGRAAASQLVLLGAHEVSHTASAASDPEFNKLGASAFLRWKAFEALAALGYGGNDLTDATLNPVTHFKSQLGGDLELTLVLRTRGTPRYRLGSAAAGLAGRLRGAAGSLVRRLAPKDRR